MSKIISISDATYRQLSRIKSNRSFSKTIDALILEGSKRGNVEGLERFFGILDPKAAAVWQKEVAAGRKAFGRAGSAR